MYRLAIASGIEVFLTLWAIFSAPALRTRVDVALTAFRLFNSVDSFEPSRDCSAEQDFPVGNSFRCPTPMSNPKFNTRAILFACSL